MGDSAQLTKNSLEIYLTMGFLNQTTDLTGRLLDHRQITGCSQNIFALLTNQTWLKRFSHKHCLSV